MSQPSRQPHSQAYEGPLRTVRTRPVGDLAAILPPLRAMAELYGRIERRLFAAILRGEVPEQQKSAYLTAYGLTARQFNAIVRSVRGKIAGARAQRRYLIGLWRLRIKRAKAVITRLTRELAAANTPKASPQRAKRRPAKARRARRSLRMIRQQLHQKRRRLARLEQTLAQWQADERAGRVRLCFGGRKLFRAQFHLAENGYATHADWLTDWHAARGAQIMVLGSSDEHAGCQSCVARREPDGSYTLTLRLPPALAQTYGEHLTIPGIRFAYGQEWFDQAVASSQPVTVISKQSGKVRSGYTGVPISYRLVLDQHGVEVFATMPIRIPQLVTAPERAAIGVDLNADHLALTETDASGNPIATTTIPLELEGCSRQQTLARIGEAVKQVIAFAHGTGKPLVIEDLDFARKRAALEGHGKGYKRRLSRFCTRASAGVLTARAEEAGITVTSVDLAFTSVIGRYKYAKRYGLSSHQAAALVIARRGLGYSERPPAAGHTGAMVSQWQYESGTRAVPARKRSQHVDAYWRMVLRRDARWRSRRRRDVLGPAGARSGAALALEVQGAACAGPHRQRGSPRRGRSRPRAASTVRAASVRNPARKDHGRRNKLL